MDESQINLWPWRQVKLSNQRRQWVKRVVLFLCLTLVVIVEGRWKLGGLVPPGQDN